MTHTYQSRGSWRARTWRYFKPMHRGTPRHYLTGRCPKGMPRGQWESVSTPKWPIWASVLGVWSACAVFCTTAFELAKTGARPQTGVLVGGVVVGIVNFVSIGVLWIIPHTRERRFERTVRALQYEVCWNCGYSLQGLTEIHRCPECAAEYDKETVREDWRSWFAR